MLRVTQAEINHPARAAEVNAGHCDSVQEFPNRAVEMMRREVMRQGGDRQEGLLYRALGYRDMQRHCASDLRQPAAALRSRADILRQIDDNIDDSTVPGRGERR